MDNTKHIKSFAQHLFLQFSLMATSHRILQKNFLQTLFYMQKVQM